MGPPTLFEGDMKLLKKYATTRFTSDYFTKGGSIVLVRSLFFDDSMLGNTSLLLSLEVSLQSRVVLSVFPIVFFF